MLIESSMPNSNNAESNIFSSEMYVSLSKELFLIDSFFSSNFNPISKTSSSLKGVPLLPFSLPT
jgi:hypothetical protein